MIRNVLRRLARLELAADSFSGLLGGNLATEREL
jgi:hypothetical protein